MANKPIAKLEKLEWDKWRAVTVDGKLILQHKDKRKLVKNLHDGGYEVVQPA